MNKSNSSGFTLIELIIVVSIFSIIMFIGYETINGIYSSTKSQQTITSNQASINLINNYLTKDIEKSTSISNKEIIEGSNYKYTIYSKDESIEYIIENYIYKGKKVYSVKRNSKGSTINIIENQERYNDTPFLINSNEENGVYEVLVDHRDNNKKQYSFYASSRINLIADSVIDSGKGEENNPELDDEEHNNGENTDSSNEDNTIDIDADIMIEYARNDKEGMNPNQLNMTNTIKVKSSENGYMNVHSYTDNTFIDKIQTLVSNHSENNGYVRVMIEKGGEKSINNIYGKDLGKVKKMVLNLEGNISIDNKENLIEIIPNKKYEMYISGTAINFDRHINISRLDKGSKGILKVNLLY